VYWHFSASHLASSPPVGQTRLVVAVVFAKGRASAGAQKRQAFAGVDGVKNEF
jgi:hypothetical protein